MTRSALFGIVALALAYSAAAGAAQFHSVCWYQMDAGSPLGASCRVSADFTADTGPTGGEVMTVSPQIVTPFVVTCDSNPFGNPDNPLKPIYNDGATRVTGGLGTQITGIHGPTPSIYLNRGAIHTGLHASESYFEATVNNKMWRGVGQCEIWADPAV